MPATESSRAFLAALLLLPASFAQTAPLSGFDAYAGWGQPLPSLLEFTSLTFASGDPLTLTAAQDGTTIRVLDTLRIDTALSLLGNFSFEASQFEFNGLLSISEGSTLNLGGIAVENVFPFPLLAPIPEIVWADLVVSVEPLISFPVWEPPAFSGSYSSGSVTYNWTPPVLSPAPPDILPLPQPDLLPIPLPAALPLLASGIGLLATGTRRRDRVGEVARRGLTALG